MEKSTDYRFIVNNITRPYVSRNVKRKIAQSVIHTFSIRVKPAHISISYINKLLDLTDNLGYHLMLGLEIVSRTVLTNGDGETLSVIRRTAIVY